MKLVSWQEWLDKHIPYYEAERHKNRFLDNPPEVVLIIYPQDDLRKRQSHVNKTWVDWEEISQNLISHTQKKSTPLFLERDTRQEWYWAFWDQNDALVSMLKLA